MLRCPGQDSRYWKPGDVFEVNCPACGAGVEFFKDEPQLKCRNCGENVVNPKIDLGCAQWCRYGPQCLSAYGLSRDDVLCHKLIAEVKKLFGDDRKRIEHALSVLDFASQIQADQGGDPVVVKAAALLHGIAIVESERKYGSSEGKYQQIEAPAVARKILRGQAVDEEVIERVCEIIAHHHTGGVDSAEFRCVWDADQLANAKERPGRANDKDAGARLDAVLKTRRGKELAREVLVQGKPEDKAGT